MADEALDEAIKDLAPHKALARVDGLARFIFSNVAVVATVIGALGLLGAGTTRTAATELFSVPVVVLLIGVSLLLALVAVTPWPWLVNRTNRTAVRSGYDRRIKVRSVAAVLATAVFACALVAAIAETARVGVSASASAVLSGQGADAKATMTVEVTGLPQDVRTTASLTALTGGREGKVLCTSVSTGSATGKAVLGCTVANEGAFSGVRAAISVKDGTDTLAEQYVDVTP